jgi:hypothetical protein
MNYIGVFFKPKLGCLVCFYNPNEMCPMFWSFDYNDDILYVYKNIMKYIKDQKNIIVHINEVTSKHQKQFALYNQFIGMLSGMTEIKNITLKIVSQDKIQKRIMHLLDIKSKKEFINKMKIKKMHNNQYNLVYEIVKHRSKRTSDLYISSYLFAYYGFLKEKIKGYNHKE